MLRPVRLYNPKHMCKIILGGCRHEVKTFWELLLSAPPDIYYSTFPLQNLPCPQWLELQLLVELDHLKNLIQGYFSEYAKYYLVKIQVLTCLGSLQLFLELGFLFFKALDLLFHLIKLSRMFTVSFIKLVPCNESLIKTLGNFCILLSQGFWLSTV